MASDYKSREHLKGRFKATEKPKEVDFSDWIDAFVHRDDSEINLKLFDSVNQIFNTTISLKANTGDIQIGSNGQNGKLRIKNAQGNTKAKLDGLSGNLYLGGESADNANILMLTSNGLLKIGGSQKRGDLKMTDNSGRENVQVYGEGVLWLGGSGQDGSIQLKSTDGNAILSLTAYSGMFSIGGNGKNGKISMKNNGGVQTIQLESQYQGIVKMTDNSGRENVQVYGEGVLWLGGSGQDGSIQLKSTDGNAILSLTAYSGMFSIGGNGKNGKISMNNNEGVQTIQLESQYQGIVKMTDNSGRENVQVYGQGVFWLGGDGQDGSIQLKNENGGTVVNLTAYSGMCSVGGNGKDGFIVLKDSNNNITINLKGEDGTIWTKGGITPDYVFDTGFQLPAVEKVNRFIQNYKHLPNIPSAREIKENGLNITDFSMKLLQKIEELTLYIIGLQEQIDELKAKK